MRTIIVSGLVWSIAICATPGLAERYVHNPNPAALQSVANQDRGSYVRASQAWDVQLACDRAVFDFGKLDDTANRASGGSFISARYDPATDHPFERTMTVPQIELYSTGPCR